jgi:uncharacterized OB-fold protein
MNEPDLEPTSFARCAVCGELTFPVHPLSPCGHDADPILEPLTEAGEVFSWTITHASGGNTPIAMADFLGGELRVTAPVLGVDEVAIGDRLVVLADADGGFFLVPEFRAA